ncbi:hypothetical protein SUGI_0327390 [Cryptomeria japonica]|nr:hypothetical protein SUGI_0327390 [Cryptomeria japonica]
MPSGSPRQAVQEHHGGQSWSVLWNVRESAQPARGIEVIVGARNEELEKIAGNQAAANGWVKDNFGAFYPAGNIKYILVGKEVLHYGNEKYVSYLVPAMRNIQTAVRNANLHYEAMSHFLYL